MTGEPAGELDGLRAVVTGSSRGLGAAIARDLHARGARVVVNGTDPERTRAVANALGDRVPAVVGSVADETIADALIATCVEAYGGIDLLVNNAGITRDALLTRASAEQFDAVIGVNLRGTWLASRAAARAMKGAGGQIVNVVSGTALFGNLGQSVYAAAKGGVLAMTRTLALELTRSGIRVNAIAPVVNTEMVQPLLALDASMARFFGEPDAVAPVVALLAGLREATPGLTGVVLGYDGTRLTAWTHPEAAASIEARDLDGLRAALAELPHPTPNPDEFGAAVMRALGVQPL